MTFNIGHSLQCQTIYYAKIPYLPTNYFSTIKNTRFTASPVLEVLDSPYCTSALSPDIPASHFALGVGAPQKCVGFVPGDFENVAVSRDINRIPLKAELRPEDRFELHHRIKHPQHKRQHLPKVIAHGPTEMRPKWLSERMAMDAQVK